MDRTTARAANMAVQDGATMITGKMVMAATGTVVTITMLVITTTMDTIAMGTTGMITITEIIITGMITTGMITITKRSTTTITKMIEGRLAASIQHLEASSRLLDLPSCRETAW
jgi:hypothetical protein